MMSEYLEPEKKQDDNKVQRERNSPSSNREENTSGQKKNSPNKKKNFKLLHEDGSLADLPYNNNPGGGPNEGVVGIGT